MNKYNIKTTKAFEEELLDIYSYIVDYLQEPKIANEKYKKIRKEKGISPILNTILKIINALNLSLNVVEKGSHK